MQEKRTTCKSGAPTLDGSNYSSMSPRKNNSSTGQMAKHLMSMVERMKKEDKLSFGASIMELTRDGEYFILTKLKKFNPRDLTKTSDGTLTDHSTSNPDSQCTELLNALELTTLSLRDGERTLHHNNSSSMELTRPSDPTTGRIMLWKSKVMEDQAT